MRSNAVDQRGNEVSNWAEEGPFSSGEAEDVLRPLLPEFTFPTGPSATNFPVPWVVLSRGLGVLIDQDQRSRFRFEGPRRRYGAQAALGSLARPFAPCELRLDGRRLPARFWNYDRNRQVLQVRTQGRELRLVARGRC